MLIYYKMYNKLILSGGGIKGFQMLGSIQYLFDNNSFLKYI